ncbi:MAG: glycosyltransferase family 2 protein [Nitrospirota bacterium]|nr:glycosyltransferase family 2 protein [Nitrospirota bacterium]
MFDITISIVSYNSKNVIKNCIHSILETTSDIQKEIIVVDNCSEDGSAELVKTRFPDVRLIENRENVGFGKAHNQSFRISKGNHFLILNPDTIIFPNAINKMVEFMDNHKDVGVSGCKIFWDDDKNFMFPDLRIHNLKTSIIQFTPFCSFFPNSLISKWYWKTAYPLWDTKIPIEVDGITGGLMLVRREAFESVGFFDENFFLFFEEHDLLRRIKKGGWEIYYLPDAEIQHYFEESFRNSSIDIDAVYMQSALYYYKKHYKIPGYLFIKMLLILSKFVHSFESKTLHSRNMYAEVCPVNSRLMITWPSQKGAMRYLVEVSYSPSFSDRGGMYVEANTLSLKSDILNRLPNKTGFLRILPVYTDNSTGKVIQVIKITK